MMNTPGTDAIRRMQQFTDNLREAFPEKQRYILHSLPDHLQKCRKFERLDALLINFGFIQAKVNKTGPISLISDYSIALSESGNRTKEQEENLTLIREALELSAHILTRDTQQTRTQLLSRLFSWHAEVIEELKIQIKAIEKPWLCSLSDSLMQAGGPLIKTIDPGINRPITQLALHPNGKHAIFAIYQEIFVWDLENEIILTTLNRDGESTHTTALIITPDGKRLISVAQDKKIKVWRLENNIQVGEVSIPGFTHCVAVLPDNDAFLAGFTNGEITLWDINNLELLRKIEGHSDTVDSIIVSPSGDWFASSSADQSIKIWDTNNWALRNSLIGHTSRVFTLALTPDDEHILSGAFDNTLRMWSVTSGRELWSIDTADLPVVQISVTPDGEKALTCSRDHKVRVWDLAKQRESNQLVGHSGSVTDMQITFDGNQAITSSVDYTLRVWDLNKIERQREWVGHPNAIGTLKIVQNGKNLISTGLDGSIFIWDLSLHKIIREIHGHGSGLVDICETDDGKTITSFSRDKTIKVWDTETGDLVQELGTHNTPINTGILAPDHRCLITASEDGVIKVWDLRHGKEIFNLFGHQDNIRSLAVSADGKRLVSCSSDGTVKVWDLQDGVELKTLLGHSRVVTDIVITPDNQQIISASADKTIKVWSLATGEFLHDLSQHKQSVNQLMLNQDGTRLFCLVTDAHEIRVWDLEKNCELLNYRGHDFTINSFALHPNGLHVISAGLDSTVNIWEIKTGKTITSFSFDVPIQICEVYGDDHILLGDFTGRVHFLKLIQQ